MALKLQDIRGASGYDPYEHFFASRYMQGGRAVYSIDWSVRELVTFLPKPNPDKPLGVDATQRRIVPAHAKGFAEYVRNDPGWVSPALLLRAPAIFKFQPVSDLDTGTTQFGLLSVPKDSKAEIQIVDGQHRTLGFHLAWETLSSQIEKFRIELARSREGGDPLNISVCQKALDKALNRRETLGNERVSVQIVIVETPEIARRVFVDINDNAKGITGAVKSRFDDRKVISRALNMALHESELLRGRVDLEQDRVSGTSPFLLGAKHVADILRALTVGNGRIGKRVEEEADEKRIVAEFESFAVALVRAFPDLNEVVKGNLTPSELRSANLIGSNVMLRGFALAWFELKRTGWSSQDLESAFRTLSDQMEAPVMPDPTDTWFATGLFPATENGSYSPTSRLQDIRALADFIVEACNNSTDWTRVKR